MIDWSVLSSVGRRVRVNHALEHATISLLTNTVPHVMLRGRSNRRGFYVMGEVDHSQILSAANDALNRLRGGQSDLAIHPFCGTNLAVTGTLTGLSAALAARIGRRAGSYPAAILAALLAVLVAQPLGLMTQRYLTTDSRMGPLTIDGVERKSFFGKTLHFVRTSP